MGSSRRLALAFVAGAAGCTPAHETVDPRGATIVQLAGVCRGGGQVCDDSLAALGVSPPRGRVDLALAAAPEVRVTASGVSFERRPVVSLAQGRAAPGAFEGHVSASLRAEVEALAASGRWEPARAGEAAGERVLVLADGATPFATLGDVLFTLAVAGPVTYELVIREGDELGGQLVHAASAWVRHDPDVVVERSLPVGLVVLPDGVTVIAPEGEARRFGLRPGCEAGPDGCHDLRAIGDHVAALKGRYPHEVTAVFRVDGEVRLQALVALIDVVRGVGCRLEPAIAQGEAIPDACLFWQATVNFEPAVRLEAEPRSR